MLTSPLGSNHKAMLLRGAPFTSVLKYTCKGVKYCRIAIVLLPELLPSFYLYFELGRMGLKCPCFLLQNKEIDRGSVDLDRADNGRTFFSG